MSKREGEDDAGGPSKLPKTNDRRTPEIAFDQNPSPNIFKLHVIVCFELFDYLSLEDIHSIGQTCKRFNRIAGNFFQDNYPHANIKFKEGEIYHNGTQISGFRQYVNYITLHGEDLNDKYGKHIVENYKSLKKIYISPCQGEIDKMNTECIRGILPQIENIKLNYRKYDGLYEKLLKYCSNIKSITLWYGSMETACLQQKYPTLEHFCYYGIPAPGTSEYWEAFFEQNSHIRSFGCFDFFLEDNEDWLLTTNTKFDYLSITNWVFVNTNRIRSLVSKLYERGFYKKLRLEFSCGTPQNEIDEMCKLPGIERLIYYSKNINFPVMINVKEFASSSCGLPTDDYLNYKTFCQFPNVERIDVWRLEWSELLKLVGQLKELKELRVFKVERSEQVNVWALNNERGKLIGAGKVTICVGEAFIATKWAYNNRDFEFIEIKRYDSLPRLH